MNDYVTEATEEKIPYDANSVNLACDAGNLNPSLPSFR